MTQRLRTIPAPIAPRLRALVRPIVLLGLVSVLSLGARVAWLAEPCREPCRSAADHVLVFDEAYYVNAARVIAGVSPPANANYATAPRGDDPNAEHPQLVKLLMAGSIELFGDGPLAWRLTTIVFGSLAILGMFALVRAAGGGEWPALAAATLMACDNLLLVHGRIGTLDVPALAPMIWAVVAYLRRRPVLAGVLIGVGSCIKLVAPYALLVLIAFESLRVLAGRRGGAGAPGAWSSLLARLGGCAAAAAAVFIGLLALLDRIAPPYDPVKAKLLAGGPFQHLAHMVSYGASQSSPHGPHGIASYPWTWIVDYKPIVYLNVNPAKPTPDLVDVHPSVHFLGMMSPPIMLLALPSLALVVWELVARRQDEVSIMGLAWAIGTFVPFAFLSAAFSRTSYIYYMVVVMPGIYLTVVHLLQRARRHRRLILLWWLAVAAAVILMYPLTPVPLP